MKVTTIAFRAGILAADSSVVTAGTRSPPGMVSKLNLGRRHRAVYGGAGSLSALRAAICALEAKKSLPWVGSRWDRVCDLDLGDDTTLFVLTQDGLFNFEGHGWFRINPGVFCALGSGEAAAVAAMHCGKTAVEAVEIACKVDNNSCLPVQFYSVDDLLR